MQTGQLFSILVQIKALHNTKILGPLGIPIHAWLLSEIKNIAPDYSEKLHQDKSKKPYTISTLLDGAGATLPVGKIIMKNDYYWIRITGCDDEFNNILLNGVIPSLKKNKINSISKKELLRKITLYKMEFAYETFVFERSRHKLAYRSSYANIIQSITNNNPVNRVNLYFNSPTSFSRDGVDYPLPSPELLFKGYLEVWNKYCPKEKDIGFEIDGGWLDLVKPHLLIDEFTSIEVHDWVDPGQDKDGRSRYIKSVGFTGLVRIKMIKKQKFPINSPIWKDTLVVFQALADYSFFCGTGRHRSVGMGQTSNFPL